MDWILETSPTFSYVFLRLGLGLTFLAHSTQQIFGWHGGRGWRGMIKNWNEKYGVPVAFGALGMAIEFFGAVAMLLGFLTRPFALALAAFIGSAMLLSHWGHGFFLARRPGEESGIEYVLALFLMALALVVGGGGALSIDGLLAGR
jgi:putative oxidoreductase